VISVKCYAEIIISLSMNFHAAPPSTTSHPILTGQVFHELLAWLPTSSPSLFKPNIKVAAVSKTKSQSSHWFAEAFLHWRWLCNHNT